MNIPKSPEEAKMLERKIAANKKAGDWVTSVFPYSGIGNPNQARTETLLRTIGEVRLPTKPK